MPCRGKRVSFNQTSRRVAISPSGNTLPVNNTVSNHIPNNVPTTCVHTYQLQNTLNFGGKNYRVMKCSKCGNTKTVFLV